MCRREEGAPSISTTHAFDARLRQEIEAVAHLAEYARRHGLTALDETLTAVLARLHTPSVPVLMK